MQIHISALNKTFLYKKKKKKKTKLIMANNYACKTLLESDFLDVHEMLHRVSFVILTSRPTITNLSVQV